MSTRQLLNLALGAVALLLIASGTLVWNQGQSSASAEQQIDLAQKQQVIIQDLGRQVASLQQAELREEVAAARRQVGRAVLAFDRNLAVMAQGGMLTGEDGSETAIVKVKGGKARQTIEDALQTWRLTGAPLADLSAGEYSVYSAAGQDAVQGLEDNTIVLMEQMGAIANALSAGVVARQALAGLARWATGIFVLLLVVLAWLRAKVSRFEQNEIAEPVAPEQDSRDQAAQIADALTTPGLQRDARPRSLTPPAAATRKPGRQQATPGSAYTPAVDFESINATVDRMTVDMDTIASSTDKMRSAIDSVGHALQGMLSSLNEMAQDSDEGHKIVRGANNAASFTAEAASDLVATAREMSGVVGRVTQLAMKTRQVAGQIDAEAVATGQTGKAFTSVVAAEVKALATQTSRATREIEDTVAEILAISRQYEESIGQIIKNISAINRVSQHLGELMLAPPPVVVPAELPNNALTPPAADPEPEMTDTGEAEDRNLPEPPVQAPDPFSLAADEEPVPAAADPVMEEEPAPQPEATRHVFSLDDEDPPLPDLEEVTDETRKVIEELGLADPEPEPTPEPELNTSAAVGRAVDSLLAGSAEDAATPTSEQDDPADEEEAPPPTVEGKTDAEADAIADPADATAAEPAPAPEVEAALQPAPEATLKAPQLKSPIGSNGNVFMLNKPKNILGTSVGEDATNDLPVEGKPEPILESVPFEGGNDGPKPTVIRLDKSKKTD